YAGLDRAVEEVFGAEPAWFVEYDAAPSKILAHHYPGVPNYGDVTTVDWASVPPVAILTGGSPCQDLSNAGKRAGMTDGTRSNLWA
ncbi:DNA cytosine methyltransferase, partial [Mycobacterium kansasii]